MTKIGKKLAAVFLAVAMVVTFMPVLGTQTAYAASGDPAMNLGTEVLNKNVNTANPESVWYADTTWRVIGYDGTGAATVSGAATLLAANELDRTKFDTSSPYSNVYAGSALEEKVNGILNRFTPEERAAINARTLVHGSYNTESPWDTDCIAGDTDLENVFLWPLSAKEGNALNYNLRENSGDFWLRSPGKEDNRAFYIKDTGTGSTSTVDWNFAVRPAFHLNIGSVLLTSAAEGGKPAGTQGELSEVPAYTGSEWKLTIHDNDHSAFAAEYTGRAGDVVTFSYSGAKTGEGEYISAVIADEDGTVKYYGNLSKLTSSSSSTDELELDLTGKYENGDTLYVFNEKLNGDKKTDYASELIKISVPYKVAFDTRGGSSIVPQYVFPGENATKPDDPTKEGTSFSGWYDESLTNRYYFDTAVNQDITLYAKWTATYGFNSYDATTAKESAGGRFSLSDSYIEDKPTYGWAFITMDTGTQSTLKAYPDDGYKFCGWYEGRVETIYKDGKVYSQTVLPKDLDDPSTLLSTDSEYAIAFEQNGAVCAVFECAGHQWEQKAQKATPTADGRIYQVCSVCGTEETIAPLLKVSKISLAGTSYTYTGKEIKPKVIVANESETLSAENYTVTYSKNKNVGTATAKVTLKGDYYEGSKNLTFQIAKAANPLTVKAKTATVKYSKLKKKAQTLAVTKLITFKKDAKDKKTYTLSSAKKGKKSFKKYFKINKSTGKVTVKKGLKKGTYKVKVKVKANGNANYKASAVKTVTFKVKVK